MINKTYPVHEMFTTFQGEGCFMGVPAFFIRLFGCPIHCPWCDSAGTWHPKFVPTEVPRLSAEDLAREALASNTTIVVITGGEPAVHDLDPLCRALHEQGFKVHIETSGHFPVRGRVDWMTLSPKKWGPPIKENIGRVSEFKFIIEEPADIEFYTRMIGDLGFNPMGMELGANEPEVPIWLHPEWSQVKLGNSAVLLSICDAVKKGRGIYRAGYQLHKLYNVDAGDKRTRPLVPLGGNEARNIF